jgi:PrtD family type I secretion system ABC transporter
MTDTRTHARNQRTALKEALRRSRGGFIAVALFSLCINMLMLAAPLYMMQLYDRVLSSRNIDTLVLLTIMAAGAILTMSLLDMIRGQAMVRLGGWIDRKVSPDLLTASIAQTLRRGETPSVQGLRDLGTFRTFLTGPAMFPIMDAPWTPIFLAVIFMLHPVLGWVATGGAMVLSALAVANELSTRKLLQMSGGASIMALQQAEAAARNADVIEAMGMMPALVRRWHERNSQHVTLQAMASHRSGAIGATSKFVRLLLQIGILGAGAYLAIQTEISPGAMIAASIIMGRALSPVEQAIGSWRSGIAARNAYGRIKTQLEEEPPRGERMRLPEPKGALNVEAVSYVHPSADEPVLRNISFALEPGESLGLIGPTAAGKTTLARLLVGNILPRAGHIRIDGADVAVWESEDRGKHVGYLPQDVELFAGTVRENIARMGEGSPEAVVAAARMAGVHELILGLPKGYDTEIGEGGAALSGGQRQRIGLARALFGSPRFVVLDEPNASLDHEGEAALLQALRDLKDRNVTVVVIAHRPTILQHVDKILVLRDGQVQHFGAPADVVPKVTGQQRPAPPHVVTGGGGEGG